MRKLFTAITLASLLLPAASLIAADATAPAAPAAAAAPAGPVTLPKDIVWETNNDDPLIGSEKAIRGGRHNAALFSYPLTFRLFGPNSNDSFAWWNRAFTISFILVTRHPVTDKYIPMMATHWSVQPDQKTIYFKLDPDARWSDGKPVTADDYVFTLELLKSKFIVDPFYNSYAERYIASVDKIDDYTLRVVGTRPSWRPLADYGELYPIPKHATVLDETWVTRTNNELQIGAGPYVVSSVDRGISVTFKRIPNWWGDKKRYFTGLWNFDEIHLKLIQPERELDYVRLGELDMMVEGIARQWNEGYNFPAVRNGWLRRARVFVDVPEGVSGMHMNIEAPIFQNRDFRIAIQHLFDFGRLNRNLMYNEYFRKVSFFTGTEYANPNLKPYEFSSEQAREHLEKAGYHRPDTDQGTWAKLRNVAYGLLFTRSDTDDILVNDRGEKASFTVNYAGKGFERHLTVFQQDLRRAGIDMRLQLLEPGTAFQRALEGKFEAYVNGMGASFYPDPRQYLHSEFKDAQNSNAFWGYSSKEVDDLIKIYEEDVDAEKRRAAMWRIDQIVHDEAFELPFWTAPYTRLVYWDYIQFPEFYLPKRTQSLTDWMVYWIDPEKKATLEEAKRTNKAYPVDENLDKDFYNVRAKLQ
jgi:microcin C transport system substrate-binding protein